MPGSDNCFFEDGFGFFEAYYVFEGDIDISDYEFLDGRRNLYFTFGLVIGFSIKIWLVGLSFWEVLRLLFEELCVFFEVAGVEVFKRLMSLFRPFKVWRDAAQAAWRAADAGGRCAARSR